MSQEKTFETVEEYAKYIQNEMHTLAVKIQVNPDRASIYALGLCSEAAGIVQAGKMKQEVDAGDFDLSTLPKPKDVTPAEDVESPFYGE